MKQLIDRLRRTTSSEPAQHADLAVLFGVPIDNVSMDQTVDLFDDFIEAGRYFGWTHQVTTVNVDFLVNAVKEPDVLDILQSSDLNLPDGMPVVWGSSWVGTPLTARVTGADLVPRLVAESERRSWRIHFFGSTPEVIERAAALAAEQHPNALVTWDTGPEDLDVDAVSASTIASIQEVNADIVCVALGNPKQERFIARHGNSIGAPVMIGIGGSLDLWTGEKKRAPKWVQNTGLEWIFRALQEPRRLGTRYLRDVRVFAPRIAAYVPRARKHRAGADFRVETVDDRFVLRFGHFDGFDDAATWPPQPGHVTPRALHIDFGNVRSIGPAAHSTLVAMIRFARRRRIQISCVNVDPRLEDCLARYGSLGMVGGLFGRRDLGQGAATSSSTPEFRTIQPPTRVENR